MNQANITFIGGGNMAYALIGGLLNHGWSGQQITVADPTPAALERLSALDEGITVTTDNTKAVVNADVVVLATKPQVLKSVAEPLAPAVAEKKPLIVSIAAGLLERDINRWLGGDLPMVRCMPNTPAMVGQGATGLFANTQATKAQRELAENLLAAVGICVWVESEPLLDAVTAVSGSGPAYLFMVIESMEKAGIELGLPADVARQLSIQTALGSSTLAAASEHAPAELRRQVTSPGGTTEQAIKTFEEGQLADLFARAMKAASDRAGELAEQLGKD